MLLPNISTLKSTIQRIRQHNLGASINPIIFYFDIPDKFTKTTDGELFLQFDSGFKLIEFFFFFVPNEIVN